MLLVEVAVKLRLLLLTSEGELRPWVDTTRTENRRPAN